MKISSQLNSSQRTCVPVAAIKLAPLAVAVLLACFSWRTANAQDWLRWATPRPVDFLKSSPRMLSAFRSVAVLTRGSVLIIDADGEMAALGTVIDANGLLITKASEVERGRLTCVLETGEEVEAKIVATDERNDVALLRIPANGLKPITWATNDTTVGQWVVTPGSGDTAAAVGIVSVPARRIMPKRALIGVILDANNTPPRIVELMPGFGAAKAGLEPGDSILSVNGKPVKTRDEMVTTLRTMREGQQVKLHVRRDTVEFDIAVEMFAESTVLASRSAWGGRGFNREERMNRMGSDVSGRAEDFELAIQHDTVLEPWQCGGPLVDLDGRAVGINIARAGRVASYALPAELVKRIIQKLKPKAGSPVSRQDSQAVSGSNIFPTCSLDGRRPTQGVCVDLPGTLPEVAPRRLSGFVMLFGG